MKRLLTLPLSFLIFISQHSFAQEKKVIISWGYTTVLDYYASPVKQQFRYDISNQRMDTIFLRNQGFSLFKYYFNISRNLFELGSNQSFALDITPGIGFGLSIADNEDLFGLGNFTLPIMLAYGRGVGSSYSCASNYGLTVKAGLQLVRFPIGYTEKEAFPEYKEYVSTWAQPAFSVGFRRWKKNKSVFGDENNPEVLAEINLFVGVGDKRYNKNIYNGLLKEKYIRSLNISISFIRFLNF